MRYLLSLLFVLVTNITWAQSVAHYRANKLGQGINISFLENYWGGNSAINYTNYLDYSKIPAIKSNISLARSLNFKTVRLPICFSAWENNIPPYTIDSSKYFYVVDSILNWCKAENLNLVIDFHHGILNSSNYSTQLPRVIQLWKQVATHYATADTGKVFFEIYNEPFDITTMQWKNAAKEIIDSIRPILPHHTFIVGGNEWNSIGGLNNFGTLSDNNIIYTFHFYEPFAFTHQGASWVGDAVSTTGISYPGNFAPMPPLNPLATAIPWANGMLNYYPNINKAILNNWMQGATTFKANNNVPIWCGEWGSYSTFAPNNGSRCRYTQDIKSILDSNGINNAYWEMDQGFGFFNSYPASFATTDSCFKAIWGNYPTQLMAKVFLAGCYDSSINLMWDSLSKKSLIPSTTPYGTIPYTNGFILKTNAAPETITPSLLSATGNYAVVDWVLVQLRSASNKNIIVASKSALLLRNGLLAEASTGNTILEFLDVPNGDYYVSIKHRNHLGVLTRFPIALGNTANTLLDFTSTSLPLFSYTGKASNPVPLSGPTKVINGKRCLYAGNCNLSAAGNAYKFITYNNTQYSDRQALLTATGANGVLSGYSIYDCDLNGLARFNGLNPDRFVILNTCLNSNTVIITEQTPN
jgi:endoglucanase